MYKHAHYDIESVQPPQMVLLPQQLQSKFLPTKEAFQSFSKSLMLKRQWRRLWTSGRTHDSNASYFFKFKNKIYFRFVGDWCEALWMFYERNVSMSTSASQRGIRHLQAVSFVCLLSAYCSMWLDATIHWLTSFCFSSVCRVLEIHVSVLHSHVNSPVVHCGPDPQRPLLLLRHESDQGQWACLQ